MLAWLASQCAIRYSWGFTPFHSTVRGAQWYGSSKKRTGVHFLDLPDKQKSRLQDWLALKLEEILLAHVLDKFNEQILLRKSTQMGWLVGPAGIEPATPGLEIRCSIQLSYGPAGRNPL